MGTDALSVADLLDIRRKGGHLWDDFCRVYLELFARAGEYWTPELVRDIMVDYAEPHQLKNHTIVILLQDQRGNLGGLTSGTVRLLKDTKDWPTVCYPEWRKYTPFTEEQLKCVPQGHQVETELRTKILCSFKEVTLDSPIINLRDIGKVEGFSSQPNNPYHIDFATMMREFIYKGIENSLLYFNKYPPLTYFWTRENGAMHKRMEHGLEIKRLYKIDDLGNEYFVIRTEDLLDRLNKWERKKVRQNLISRRKSSVPIHIPTGV